MQTTSSETSTLTSKIKYQIGNYVCTQCHIVFETSYDLRCHQNDHHACGPNSFTSSSSVEDSDDALNTAKTSAVIGSEWYKARGFLRESAKAKGDEGHRRKSKGIVVQDSDSETTLTDPKVKESRKGYDDAGYDGDVEVSSKKTQDLYQYSSTKNLDFKLGFSDLN
ncbi:hypothetical protein M5689_015381 [Euphorbia peplus]|nr:hypothetical protein M5689_015381 [Euphorbia peplus]